MSPARITPPIATFNIRYFNRENMDSIINMTRVKYNDTNPQNMPRSKVYGILLTEKGSLCEKKNSEL